MKATKKQMLDVAESFKDVIELRKNSKIARQQGVISYGPIKVKFNTQNGYILTAKYNERKVERYMSSGKEEWDDCYTPVYGDFETKEKIVAKTLSEILSTIQSLHQDEIIKHWRREHSLKDAEECYNKRERDATFIQEQIERSFFEMFPNFNKNNFVIRVAAEFPSEIEIEPKHMLEAKNICKETFAIFTECYTYRSNSLYK